MGSIYRRIYLMCILLIFATLTVSTIFNIHTASQVLTVEKTKRAITIARTLQDKCKYAFTLVSPKTCECFIDRQSLHDFIDDIRKNDKDVQKALILDRHGTILSSLNIGNIGKTRTEYKLNVHGEINADKIKLKEISSGKALKLTAGIILDKVRVGTVVMQFSLDSIAEEIRHITLRAILIGGIFLILGIFLSWPIVRTIVKPIRELNINARKIGNGDLNVKVNVNSRDEVGELAEAFNLMVAKLKRTMSDLQKRMDDLGHSEALLRESEKKYRDIFENAIEGLFQIAADGSFLKVNHALVDFLGYDSTEALLSSGFCLFNPVNFVSTEKYKDIILHLEKGKEITGFEAEIIKKDKSTITVFLSVRTVMNSNGDLIRYEGLLVDITERKQMEKAELEAKTAKAASDAKSNFLANMSHEIRTPMNAVMGFTELALCTDLGDEQRNYLKKIQNASMNLLGLINDILDFSKIEAGKMEMESIEFNLWEVIDNVIDLISIKAHEKDLELLVDISSQMPCMLKGDPMRLAQVLTNLLNNAVKFTNCGEIVLKVESTVRKDKDSPYSIDDPGSLNSLNNINDASTSINDTDSIMIRFSVQDSGIGISKAEIKNIFKKFSQADETTTRRYGGTGLGLAISQLLSEMMGGKMSVKSSLGKGSTFSFTACFKLSDTLHDDFNVPEILHGKRVMVIDDNKTSLQLLCNILQSFGFKVTLANSGEDALEKLGTNVVPSFELILTDWSMSHMDGIETTRQILKNIQNNPVKVILMTTTFVHKTIKYQARQAGVTAFLNKPVTPSNLLNTIIEILSPDDICSKRSQSCQYTMGKELQGAHILLVEDNPINQEIAVNFLESFGIVPDVVENGEKAVKAVYTVKYDAVLMDIQMPVMNGYDATLKIRENPNFQNLPIIAMTANALKSSRDKAYSVGMDAHLNKPIMVKQLFITLCKYIKPDSRRSMSIITDMDKQASIDAESGLLEELPGIDINTAMELLDGSQELFEELLVMFYDDHGEDKKLIIQAIGKKEFEKAHRLVHTIKGVSGSLGCKRLYSAASTLDKRLKQGQKISDSSITNFSKAMEEVFHTIKKNIIK